MFSKTKTKNQILPVEMWPLFGTAPNPKSRVTSRCPQATAGHPRPPDEGLVDRSQFQPSFKFQIWEPRRTDQKSHRPHNQHDWDLPGDWTATRRERCPGLTVVLCSGMRHFCLWTTGHTELSTQGHRRPYMPNDFLKDTQHEGHACPPARLDGWLATMPAIAL